MKLRALLVAMLGLSVCAAPAAAQDRADAVLSPDGRHLYVSGMSSFSVEPVDGTLEPIPGSGNREGRMVIAPDGRFAYSGTGFVIVNGSRDSSAGSIHIASRDAETGLLTHEETLFGGGYPGSSGIGRVVDLELSADGRWLYVLENRPAAVKVFERDPATGRLTERQALRAGDELPVDEAFDFELTRDQRHLYLGGDRIGILGREGPDGRLAVIGSELIRGTTWQIGVSPDGRRLYAGNVDYDTWSRDPESGALTHLSRTEVVGSSCYSCTGAFIQAAPDGRSVFSTNDRSGLLHEATTTAEGATPSRSYLDMGPEARANPTAMTWSEDGQVAYVAVERGGFDVATYRRTGDGLSLIGFAPPYPYDGSTHEVSRHGGVTINDGALFTNDPDVEISVVRPFATSSMKLSNIPGVFTSPTVRLHDSDQGYPWRLDTSVPGQTVPGRSVKRVHVRFVPSGPFAIELFDDIVLDQIAPQLLSARIQGSRLKLRARDNRSGVKRVQTSANRKRPGKARRFKSSLPVGSKTQRVYVRVLDGAGNHSKWRSARRP